VSMMHSAGIQGRQLYAPLLLTFLSYHCGRAWKQNTATPSDSSAASTGTGSSNPFGNFSFAKKPSNAFGSTTLVPLAKPAAFFASTTLAAPKSATASTSAGGAKGSKYKTQQDEIAADFLENLKKWGTRKDLKNPMRQFVAKSLALEPEVDTTPALATESKHLFPAVASSAPAAVPFSFSTKSSPGAPAPSFSFGGSTAKPASSPAPASSTGFSFNLAQPAAAAPAPAAPAPAADAGDGEDGQVEDDEQIVLASADVDWNEVFQCKSRVYHHRDEGKPSRFASGDVKVQRHKTNGTRRMVMRDVAGKVLMNMGIASGMSFQKSIMQGKARVNFVGLLDKDRGSELFLLLCKTDDLDKLHSTLEELAKS
jgi:hypothetical protein